MKKNIVSLFTALMLLVTSIVPMGTISVSADNAVVTPEPLASLLADGKVKLADFSNLTEATLNDNIYKVEDGYSISINSDANYTDGADTSLRWDMPAINDTNKSTYNYKGFYIQSDYDLSQLEGYDYTLKLRYYASAPSDFSDTTGYYYRFASGLYLLNNATGSPQNKNINPRTDLKSTNVNKWATLDMVTSSQISELTYYEASKIYIRMTQVYKTGYPTTPYPIYIDSVWLELDNCDDTMTVTPSITDASNVSASSFNGYTLTFDKDIVAASDAVSVKKDGLDITSYITSTVSGNTIALSFANGVDAGSTYSVTVDKSKVRAYTGEGLSANATYTFNAVKTAEEISAEIKADLLEDGKIKIADFSDLDETRLDEYVDKIGNADGNAAVINSDKSHTYNGASTSLKWTSVANGDTSSLRIESDYTIAQFAEYDYNIYMVLKPELGNSIDTTSGYDNLKLNASLAALNTSKITKYAAGNNWSVTDAQLGEWRTDLGFYNNNGTSKLLLNGIEDVDSSSPIKLRIMPYNSEHAATVYIDSIWLELANTGDELTATPSVADKGAILANTVSEYTLTFDKNIIADDNAVTVTKDGAVVTPEITAESDGFSLKFNETMTAGEYAVTVHSSKVRAVSGEAFSTDKTYRFTVHSESDTIVMSSDKLSASVVTDRELTLIAAVYEDNTLVSVVTNSSHVGDSLTVSIASLTPGRKVKYMLVDNKTSLTPVQPCQQYTKQ